MLRRLGESERVLLSWSADSEKGKLSVERPQEETGSRELSFGILTREDPERTVSTSEEKTLRERFLQLSREKRRVGATGTITSARTRRNF